jgi:Pyruvate/2-oxoacid:ferredoxin oxidoreductase gamma subunit
MKNNNHGRIKVLGKGGQGVQFLADVLINYLGNLDYFATFFPEYDAAVRGGQITAEIAYAADQTPCPQGKNFNAAFYLTPKDGLNLKTDQEFTLKDLIPDQQKYQNMYVLGKMLNILDLPLKEQPIMKALPDKRKQNNYQLIRKGYNDYGS